MRTLRYGPLAGAACATLLGISACGQSGQDEMSWARKALERNSDLEVVAADQQSRTFTVRLKDTGELRMVRADQLVGAPARPPAATAPKPAAAVAPSPAAATPALAATAPAVAPPEPAATTPTEPATPLASALAPRPASAESGRVIESGPGYSIKASPPSEGPRGRMRDTGSVTSAAIERRHDPIVCQGVRLLHIDNRNLDFDGDAISAEDGCEIHITNSHISANGVGVSARAANVHIDNSLIEGDAGALNVSEGAQVYAADSHFKGLSRLASSAFHDLGGNVWD
ncbi:MAG TPA: right-handed parallel beta-helix repeat-containing protein [Steroidobacteraceae bacterium]|nr:right-handed parallel beta-helix repeat-containing protein [Steroidobacteraceae bacterium]